MRASRMLCLWSAGALAGPTIRITLACLAALVLGAADPYASWSQGRPAESQPLLLAQAQASDDWALWCDAGLCAADAGDRGAAVAALVHAHRLAPAATPPRQALQALSAPLPGGWLDLCGPIALPGLGWSGPILLAIAGGLLAWALCTRPRRPWLAALGGALLIVALPGIVAQAHDRARPLGATLRDTSLADAAGRTLAPLPAGTIVFRLPSAPWGGNAAISLPDGRTGFAPVADLAP